MVEVTQISPLKEKPLIQPAFYGARDADAARRLSTWLFVMCGFVAIMVTIGGATRLTDSGLSITQWDLLMGALPPLNDADWQEAFSLYKQIPEYERINKGMSLEAFKEIYWWEWGHRNFGRFIGLAFMMPLIVFWVRGALKERRLKVQLVLVFLLICGQGALGWYMVSSGLSERVDVSQYRLAAHLGLAIILFALMFWMALCLRALPIPDGASSQRKKIFRLAKFYGVFVFAQIILGAFVAGLRAGKTYNDWPLMDGVFFPEAYFAGEASILHAFETIAAVQFNHRIGAYLLFVFAFIFWLFARRLSKQFGRNAVWALLAVMVQALLGIWTLVVQVPIHLGLAHQLGALGVLALVLFNIYQLQPIQNKTPKVSK